MTLFLSVQISNHVPSRPGWVPPLYITVAPVLSHSVVSNSLRPHGLEPPGSSVHGDFQGKNTGVGCHALLQGIFPTQGSNPGLPHCRCLSHQGNPRILEWVAYPFSSRSSQPRNRTDVSCTAGGFFYQLSYQRSLWLLTLPLYRTVNILQLDQQLCYELLHVCSPPTTTLSQKLQDLSPMFTTVPWHPAQCLPSDPFPTYIEHV